MKKIPLCCTVNPVGYCRSCKDPICDDHIGRASSKSILPKPVRSQDCPNCVIEKAVDSIERALEANGEYSHNICSNAVRQVSYRWGKKKANKLIDEYDLTRIYKIRKEPYENQKDKTNKSQSS